MQYITDRITIIDLGINNQKFWMRINNITRKILQHVKKIDIFGAPVTLNIDGRSSYQSGFGGLMTLAMLIIVITLFEVI